MSRNRNSTKLKINLFLDRIREAVEGRDIIVGDVKSQFEMLSE